MFITAFTSARHILLPRPEANRLNSLHSCLVLTKCWFRTLDGKIYPHWTIFVIFLFKKSTISRYSDSLRSGRSGDRIPVAVRFSAPVQTASSLLYNAYRVFPGDKAVAAWCWPPTPSQRRGHERVELDLYSPSGPQWPVIGRTFTFTFMVK